jgi:hypothetical protein
VRSTQAGILQRAKAICAAIPLQSPAATARAAAIRSGGSVEETRLGLTVRFTRLFAGDVACFIDLEQGKVAKTRIHEFDG